MINLFNRDKCALSPQEKLSSYYCNDVIMQKAWVINEVKQLDKMVIIQIPIKSHVFTHIWEMVIYKVTKNEERRETNLSNVMEASDQHQSS